jgi:hypothetical protein
MAVVGVAVVPTDEVRRGVDAVEVLACEAELVVALAAERVDDVVVARVEVFDGEVAPELDVAEEAEAVVGRDLVVDPRDALDLLVIGRDAAADQAGSRSNRSTCSSATPDLNKASAV